MTLLTVSLKRCNVPLACKGTFTIALWTKMAEFPANTKINYQLLGGDGFKKKGGYGSALSFKLMKTKVSNSQDPEPSTLRPVEGETIPSGENPAPSTQNINLYFDTYSKTTKNSLTANQVQWEKNLWYSIVVVNDQEKGEKQIYINGMLDTTKKTFTNSIDWSKTKFTIGKGGFTVDDILIFNNALSSNEVFELHQQTK